MPRIRPRQAEQLVRKAYNEPIAKKQAIDAFTELKVAGLIDEQWDTIEQLNVAYTDTVNGLIEEFQKVNKRDPNRGEKGRINARARAEVGVLPPIFDKKGINNRKLRDVFSPKLMQAINEITGAGTVEKALKLQAKQWSVMQGELREIGRKLGNDAGTGKPIKLDIGHFIPHAWGAPQSVTAGGAELGVSNQWVGDIPRTSDFPALNRNQISTNKVDGIFETILRAEGFNTPRHHFASLLFGTNEINRYISMDQLEMVSDAFWELERPGLVNGVEVKPDMINVFNSIRETGQTDKNSLNRFAFHEQLNRGQVVTKTAAEKRALAKSGEILGVVKGGVVKGSRLVRTVGRALPIGPASLILSQQEVMAREQEYKNDPTPINKFQLDLARFALAADIAGSVPTPVAPFAEGASMAAAVTGMLVDERETVAEIGGRAAKAVKEYDTIVNAPQRAISSAVGGGARYLAGLMMPETKPQAKPKPTQSKPAKKNRLKIGGMELPEFGVSEFLGFN